MMNKQEVAYTKAVGRIAQLKAENKTLREAIENTLID